MNIAIIVFYVVIIGAMMYFMAIKPQKKEQKRQQELMDSMEIGDYVLTTSGFYGVVIGGWAFVLRGRAPSARLSCFLFPYFFRVLLFWAVSLSLTTS